MVSGIHLFGFILGFSAMEVGDLLLQHPPLLLHPLLVLRHVLLHVVEPGVQLKRAHRQCQLSQLLIDLKLMN